MVARWVALAVVATVGVGGAVVAGQRLLPPEREQDNRPGYPTVARVWIQNQTPDQSVPVRWADPAGQPVPVELVGRPSVEVGDSRPLPVRAARQGWEYRTLTLDADTDPQDRLDEAGDDGWEAVGVLPAGDRLRIVLKRPQ